MLVVLVHNQLLCYFIYCWESSCHDRGHALEQGIHLMEAGRQTKQKKYLARTSCLPCLASSLYVSIPSLVAHGHTSSKKISFVLIITLLSLYLFDWQTLIARFHTSSPHLAYLPSLSSHSPQKDLFSHQPCIII